MQSIVEAETTVKMVKQSSAFKLTVCTYFDMSLNYIIQIHKSYKYMTYRKHPCVPCVCMCACKCMNVYLICVVPHMHIIEMEFLRKLVWIYNTITWERVQNTICIFNLIHSFYTDLLLHCFINKQRTGICNVHVRRVHIMYLLCFYTLQC